MISLDKESLPQWRRPQTGYPPLTYSQKANDTLRVYLDAQDVNNTYQKGALENPNCWRDNTSTCRKQEIHKCWWYIIIFVHSTWPWIIPSHHIQHTMGKIQVHDSLRLGPIMCPGYLSMDDRLDARMLSKSYRNCWWCCHLWERWWRPWPKPTQVHACCMCNMDLSSTKRNVKFKRDSVTFFGTVWWCKWSSSWPQDVTYLSPFIPCTLYTHHTTMRTT